MILDPIPFDGSIERAGLSVPVTFTAAIDDDGALRVEFGPIAPSHPSLYDRLLTKPLSSRTASYRAHPG